MTQRQRATPTRSRHTSCSLWPDRPTRAPARCLKPPAQDLSFDERKDNLTRLFDAFERLMSTHHGDVSEVLRSITTLANQGPFADLKDPAAFAALVRSMPSPDDSP